MSDRRERDVLVIGGGITGCGVAREAALRGLRVTLLDKSDIAAGTSSRSTKLLHGGLRYLERFDLRLVREALRERETTAAMAPHLARPMTFLLPTRRGSFPGPLVARAGVALYDLLAGRTTLDRGGFLEADEIRVRAPGLRAEGLRGGVTFSDRQTDDARLTLAVARDAVRHGAEVRPGCAVSELLVRSGAVCGARVTCERTGSAEDVPARIVVNATGPWADRIRAMAGAADRALRPSRGTHLVLPDLGLECALMLPGPRPGHRLFAIPWRGVTLFGTTDDDDPSDPDRIEPRDEDRAYLLEAARHHFPDRRLGDRDVLAAFAGLRPLVRDEGDTLALSREHRIVEDRGMLSLVGGKLTTWRSMAEELVDLVCTRIGHGRPRAARSPLPGGEEPLDPGDDRLVGLAEGVPERLVEIYGAEAVLVAGIVAADPAAGEPLVHERPERVAQVDFAVHHELALHVDDVLLRRLGFDHLPDACVEAAPVVARRMRGLCGWSVEREAAELARAIERVGRERGAPSRTAG